MNKMKSKTKNLDKINDVLESTDKIVNLIHNSLVYPDWIKKIKDDEERKQAAKITIMVGDGLGFPWSVSLQEIVLMNGFVCVKARALRALIRRQGFSTSMTPEGSMEKEDFKVTVVSQAPNRYSLTNEMIVHTTVYTYQDLVANGLYVKETGGAIPSISQKYPKRTAIAKAWTYHFNDYHAVLGVSVFEDVLTHSIGDAESVKVVTPTKEVNLGNAAAEREKIQRIRREGEEKITRGPNPLREVVKDEAEATEAIESTEIIPDGNGPFPATITPIPSFEATEFPDQLTEDNAKNIELKKLKKWADHINPAIQKLMYKLEGSNTNKKLRNLMIAYYSGELAEYNHMFIEDDAKEPEVKEKIEKVQEVKETAAPKAKVEKAIPTIEEDEDEDEENTKIEAGWFFTPGGTKPFVRPMTMKDGLIKKGDVFLGDAVRGIPDEGIPMMEAYLDGEEMKEAEEEKMNAPKPGTQTPNEVFFDNEIADALGEIKKNEERSFMAVMSGWTHLTNLNIIDKFDAQIKPSGLDTEKFLRTMKLSEIKANIVACLA